jgi:phosphotransferase system IIA component
MQVEDDYDMVDGIINNGPKQPTVAELEEQVKSGQSILLTDLSKAVQREKPQKKPSVLAKLRKYQEESRRTEPKTKEKERDL